MLKRVGKLNRLLPFVAIGTIADCQSIIDSTNRAITKAGISIIAKNQHGINGISELLKQTGILDQINSGYVFNSQDIAFSLSPILNSAGRISHARVSIFTILKNHTKSEKDSQQLFAFPCKEDQLSLSELAKILIETNTSRKNMVNEIINEVEIEIEKQVLANRKSLFISGNWNKGIIGLIASRFVNKSQKPTIIVSKKIDTSILNEEEISQIKEYLLEGI